MEAIALFVVSAQLAAVAPLQDSVPVMEALSVVCSALVETMILAANVLAIKHGNLPVNLPVDRLPPGQHPPHALVDKDTCPMPPLKPSWLVLSEGSSVGEGGFLLWDPFCPGDGGLICGLFSLGGNYDPVCKCAGHQPWELVNIPVDFLPPGQHPPHAPVDNDTSPMPSLRPS